jgi:ATP-dependent exoDNAse (exonuclease V) beta subunit
MDDRFLIYRASAGSGKTYTLVKKYLELAFSVSEAEVPQRFRQILAITFTNKAANEMKERILRYLREIIEDAEHSQMAADIVEETNTTIEILRNKSRILHKAIIHNYTDFSVCTIDSFTFRVVRTFAHDLHLPLNFNVQIDKSDIVQSAVDELMAAVGTEGEEALTQLLSQFAATRMASGSGYNRIEDDIKSLTEQLFQENSSEFLSKLGVLDFDQFLSISKKLRALMRQDEQFFRDEARKVVEATEQASLRKEDYYNGGRGTYSFFENITAGDYSELGQPKSYLQSGKVFTKGYEQDPAKVRLTSVVQEAYENINARAVAYHTYRMLADHIFELALLNRLQKYVDQYAGENEIVPISDLSKRIFEVVRAEPAPFVYERIGSRYKNYMIDEFQDTSKMQWANLLPLLADGIAGGNMSLVVGDGKQAIYRFRQGDVDQFIQLPHVDNPMHGAIFEYPGVSKVENLGYNFRSREAIVTFNNDFFPWLIDKYYNDNDLLKQIFNPDYLTQKHKKEGGYVQLAFGKGLAEMYPQVLQELETLVCEKGYRYSDITILADKKDTLSNIAQYLSEQSIHGDHIPLVSSESFRLDNSKVVMFLVSLLKYLIAPGDRLTVSSVLQRWSELCPQDRTFYLQMLSGEDVDLEAMLARKGVDLNPDVLLSMTLLDCCEELIRLFHLDGMENNYVAAFLNYIVKYGKNHRQDIAEFISWFDERMESKTDSLFASATSDTNAIRLMTVHKAKGLEAPVVIYLLPKKSSRKKNIWVDVPQSEADNLALPISWITVNSKCSSSFDMQFEQESRMEDMDDVNRLYVALTRPKDQLLVFAVYNPPKGKKNEVPKDFGGRLYQYALEKEMSSRVLSVQGTAAEGDSDASITLFSSGNSETNPSSDTPKDDDTTVSLDNLSYPSWTHRISIASTQEGLFNQLQSDSIRRGLMMHEIFSHILYAGDEDAAVADYARKNDVSEEEQRCLLAQIRNVVYGDETKAFFGTECDVRTETPIVFHGSVYRPDRIVIGSDATWIVDFKTGMPSPRYEEQYHTQVTNYCQALSAMGYPHVRGYLLYLCDGQCVLAEVS